MPEQIPSPEDRVTRERAIEAYKKFVERGITNPDSLDLNDPEVQEAHALFDRWMAGEDALAEGNEELAHRVDFRKTMFYVDAGFTDRLYLEEVLDEWLMADAENVPKQSDNPERTETRRQMAQAIKKIRNLLGRSN